MIWRIKLYRLFVNIGIYLLPLLSYKVGWRFWMLICKLFDRPVLYSPQGHLSQILFGSFVWAFVSQHYRVTSFDELFRERTGARAAWSACIATAFILLATLFFSRNDIFPRGLLVCDLVTLFVLTILLHAVFRNLFRSKAH